MKFRATIDMGNAAFDDGNAPVELARILRDMADKIEDRWWREGPCADVNGNLVGNWKVTGKDWPQ